MREWDDQEQDNIDMEKYGKHKEHKLRVVATILHAAFEKCNIPFRVTSSNACMSLAHSLLQHWFTLHGETILSHHAKFQGIRLNNSGPIEYFALARLAFLALQPIRLAVFGGRHTMVGLVTYLTGFTFDGNDPHNKYQHLNNHQRMERQELLNNQDAAIYKILAVRTGSRARVNLFVDNEFEQGVDACCVESAAMESSDMTKANPSVIDALNPVFNALPGPSALPMELWHAGIVVTFTLKDGNSCKEVYNRTDRKTNIKIEHYKEIMTELEESMFATFLAFNLSDKDREEGKSVKNVESSPPVRKYKHLIHQQYNDLLTPKAVRKPNELNYTMEIAAIQHNIFMVRKLFMDNEIVKSFLASNFSDIQRGPFMYGTNAYASGEVSRMSRGFGELWLKARGQPLGPTSQPHYLSKLGGILFFFLGVAATHERAHQHAPTVLFNPLSRPTFQPCKEFLLLVQIRSIHRIKSGQNLGANQLARHAASTLTKIVSTTKTTCGV